MVRVMSIFTFLAATVVMHYENVSPVAHYTTPCTRQGGSLWYTPRATRAGVLSVYFVMSMPFPNRKVSFWSKQNAVLSKCRLLWLSADISLPPPLSCSCNSRPTKRTLRISSTLPTTTWWRLQMKASQWPSTSPGCSPVFWETSSLPSALRCGPNSNAAARVHLQQAGSTIPYF